MTASDGVSPSLKSEWRSRLGRALNPPLLATRLASHGQILCHYRPAATTTVISSEMTRNFDVTAQLLCIVVAGVPL